MAKHFSFPYQATPVLLYNTVTTPHRYQIRNLVSANI